MSFYYSILQTVFGNIKNFHTLCFSASANYPLCLCFFFYAWKSKQENTVIFVRLSKNRLIQTESNQIAKQQIQEELILIGEKILKFNLMLKQTKGPTVDVTSVILLSLLWFSLQMVHAIVAIETKPFSSISLCCCGVFAVAACKLLY